MKKLFVSIVALICCVNINAQQTFTLEDIWLKYTFRPKAISEIRPVADGEHYCILTRDGIEQYEYKTGEKTGYLVDFSALSLDKNSRITDYAISKNNEKILLAANPEFIYRRSFVADYYIYNVKDKSVIKLRQNKVRLAEFSPNADKVAFVMDNNIYITDLNTMTEKQITFDGQQNRIINGTTDWVYEEEFAITKGFFWNNNGDEIAYYRFDESHVKQYTIPFYLVDSIYPKDYTYKYPKAGEDNSFVDIYVYNLNTGKSTKVDIEDHNDIYLPRMSWTKDDNQLCYTWMNRHQNELRLYLVNTKTMQTDRIFTDSDKCYVEQPEDVIFLNDKKNAVVKSERNGYMNLYLLNIETKKVTPITQGNYDVADVCYVDSKEKCIYFTAASTFSYNRELFKVNFDGKKLTQISDKNRLGIYTAQFSDNGKYYIGSYSDASTPTVYTINDNKGKVLVTLEDNKALKEQLIEYNVPNKEFASFVTTLGDTLNYWILKPKDFNPNKKYPLLFYVYGGPGSQEVLNSQARFFDYMWFRLLTQKGYVVACVDGRGTGMRGSDFKKCTYLNLGDKECTDQMESAKYFGSLNFIDKSRIGIFGWSYGGYMSSLCITRGHEYFKTAIAVAPVTNWRMYDNVYTERFMRTPQENAEGYDNNCPINFADLLEGNFLLIHGSADDNVHLQNTMKFTDELIKHNKQFLQFTYPDKNHSIYGGNVRYHLYQMMTSFLEKNL
ncbi:MAG: S9 family peptidase [Bacteroidales bacterium]|nr:S9 family peptidase [Bacteroidales bacterium]